MNILHTTEWFWWVALTSHYLWWRVTTTHRSFMVELQILNLGGCTCAHSFCCIIRLNILKSAHKCIKLHRIFPIGLANKEKMKAFAQQKRKWLGGAVQRPHWKRLDQHIDSNLWVRACVCACSRSNGNEWCQLNYAFVLISKKLTQTKQQRVKKTSRRYKKNMENKR